MPIYRLMTGQEIPVAARQLHVRAWDSASRVPVGLRAEHRPGVPAEVWRPSPDRTILPAVREPVVLRAVPPTGRTAFGDDASVTVHLQVDPVPHGEPEEVLLPEVPVAGRAAPELLELLPQPQATLVRAVRVPVAEPVEGLAARVGAEARRRLGTDEIPDDVRAALTVGVDVSGSMRGPVADGSVTALVDAVVGLARVVGDGEPARVLLLGDRPRQVPTGADLAAEIRRDGFGVGFRPSVAGLPAARPATSNGRTLTYLVTDAEPPDTAALPGTGFHLLIAGTADPRQSPDRSPVPCTVLAPPPATLSATDFLLTPDGAPKLDALVSSMVTHWEGAIR